MDEAERKQREHDIRQEVFAALDPIAEKHGLIIDVSIQFIPPPEQVNATGDGGDPTPTSGEMPISGGETHGVPDA